MRLTGLSLTHFRNLAPMELGTPPEGVVLEGANGQGKTNFLEAIHLLARFRSFRGTPVADAIAFGADHFRVEGSIVGEDGTARTVAMATDGASRRIALDGRGVTPTGATGAVVAVLVAPEDLALVVGSPSRRRAYLDGVLSVVSRRYRRALREFERALRQRNEALRVGASEAVLKTWDEALIATGVPVVMERMEFVARLGERFAAVAGSIAGGAQRGEYALAYEPSVPVPAHGPDAPDVVSEAWVHALHAERAPDRGRGWTGAGPHRDEMAISLAGRTLARFGSMGEQRTAAIALRLLEADVLEEELETRPILLLDDVFSELDEERGARLLDRLDDGARRQRFVTTPRPLGWIDGALPRWRIASGRIVA
ncbi:MAG: DNA replication/repair protein RecF [Gemmatimonadota bacterium]